jgi:hypothetical protein
MDYTEGKIYIIDNEYNNGGEVELVRVYGKHFCRVRDIDTKVEWDTMLHRLTDVQVSDTTEAK